MAGSWTFGPQASGRAHDDRRRARAERALTSSLVAVHAVMLTIVLSVTVGVLLLTTGATMISVDVLHETFAGFQWPTPDEILGPIIRGMFQDLTFG